MPKSKSQSEQPEYTHAFKLGALEPTEGLELVVDAMERAHLLYNDMIAIERRRMAAERRFWAERGGYTEKLDELRGLQERARELKKLAHGVKTKEVQSAWAAVSDMERSIRKLESAARKDSAVTPESKRRKERAAELHAAAKARGEKLTAAEISAVLDSDPLCLRPRDARRLELVAEYEREGKDPSHVRIAKILRDEGLVEDPLDEINEAAKEEAKIAKVSRGVHWMYAELVEDAVKRAVKDSKPKPPSFDRDWNGDGAIGVRWQQKSGRDFARLWQGTAKLASLDEPQRVRPERDESLLSWSELKLRGWTHQEVMANASRRADRTLENVQKVERRLGLKPKRHRQLQHPERGCNASYATLRIRIWDSVRKCLSWASVPVTLSGVDIPLDAQVVSIRLQRKRVGLHFKWSVIVLAKLDRPVRTSAEPGDGVVAVDSCWRVLKDGTIRAGAWADSKGNTGFIDLPVDARQKHDASRSNSELLSYITSDAMLVLHSWCKGRKGLPEWMKEDAPYYDKWTSGRKISALVNHWRDNRFPGDGKIFSEMVTWNESWRHLFDWIENNFRTSENIRRDAYRKAAFELASRYDVVLVRGLDFAKLKERKRQDETDGLVKVGDAVRGVMTLVAPGELRECIERAAKRHGRLLRRVEFTGLATTCNECGGECDWDRAEKVSHKCEHCGAEWDQDLNAARNMLNEHEKTLGGEKPAKKTARRDAKVTRLKQNVGSGVLRKKAS